MYKTMLFSSLTLIKFCILLTSSVWTATAFFVGPLTTLSKPCSWISSNIGATYDTRLPSTDNKGDVDSHDQLMYALGVNLARQLGDIRPLMENPAELTQVARGLLDTVVGKLSEEEQRALLKTRGKEINELITDRA